MTWLGLAVHLPDVLVIANLKRRREHLVKQIAIKRSIEDDVRNSPSPRASFGVRLIKLKIETS